MKVLPVLTITLHFYIRQVSPLCVLKALFSFLGFIVPVPLSEEFWALVRDIDIASSSLPRPGAGYSGEFTGLMADYVRELQKKIGHVSNEEERLAIMKEEAERKV